MSTCGFHGAHKRVADTKSYNEADKKGENGGPVDQPELRGVLRGNNVDDGKGCQTDEELSEKHDGRCHL